MNTRFETPRRCSAAGVTTASILVMILAMAASTLFPTDAPTSNVAAATATQAQASTQVDPVLALGAAR
jgi:hypothetical protein